LAPFFSHQLESSWCEKWVEFSKTFALKLLLAFDQNFMDTAWSQEAGSQPECGLYFGQVPPALDDDDASSFGLFTEAPSAAHHRNDLVAAEGLVKEPTSLLIRSVGTPLVPAHVLALTQVPFLPENLRDGRKWEGRFFGVTAGFPPQALTELLAVADEHAPPCELFPWVGHLAQKSRAELDVLQLACDELLAFVSDDRVAEDTGAQREVLRQSLAAHHLIDGPLVPFGSGRLLVQPNADGSNGSIPLPIINVWLVTNRRANQEGFAYIMPEPELAAMRAMEELGYERLLSFGLQRATEAKSGVCIDSVPKPRECRKGAEVPHVFELVSDAATPEALCDGLVITVQLPIGKGDEYISIRGVYVCAQHLARFTVLDGAFLHAAFAYTFHLNRRHLRKNAVQKVALYQRHLFMECATELRRYHKETVAAFGL
jgi:hypothetical protein